jgi:FlaA1/EpsC-like NDP-sugar epimerase
MLRYRQSVIAFVQIWFVLLGYGLAFALRFEFQISDANFALLLKTLPLLLICRLSAYYLFKLNSGWWRFVSMMDLANITKAIVLGSVGFVLGVVFLFGLEGCPRSVFVLEALLNFVLLGGIRFGVRWFRETTVATSPKQLRHVLVVGAGQAGAKLINEIRLNPSLGIEVLGFIDDDPRKRDAVIQGVAVLGDCEDIPRLATELDIDEIILSIPCAGYKKISEIVSSAKSCGVKTKVLPTLTELIEQGGLWQQLRNVPPNELLDRPVLKFRRDSDLQQLEKEIRGKNVLITGAAGSIGSELTRQVAKRRPRVLVLYERNETALYYLELDMRKKYPDCEIVPVVGDILHKSKLNQILSEYNVNLIYHAAAYKHVPMMEREPFEAIRNNVVATEVLAAAAVANRVEKCVYLSTDKAVNPSSIMGTSKRIGEMVLQAFASKHTRFIMVRFGNVIGSNGSVIPLFKKQIARGGPVTVTHPDVTRYFMAISEAAQLVMTAGAMGKGGEILLLDMGDPVRIIDLANKLIESSGFVPGKDIEVKFIGLRPGEKLHEELYWLGENIVPTANRKITRLQAANGFESDLLLQGLNSLKLCAKHNDRDGLLRILRNLVREGNYDGNGRKVPTMTLQTRKPLAPTFKNNGSNGHQREVGT